MCSETLRKNLNQESNQDNNQHFTLYPKVRLLPSPPLASVPLAATLPQLSPVPGAHNTPTIRASGHVVLLGEEA